MRKKDLDGLLRLCEDLQPLAHLGDVTTDIRSLSYSCDLLLRNMIMMIEKEKNGESFTKEFHYISSNLLAAHWKLTGEDQFSTGRKYNILD